MGISFDPVRDTLTSPAAQPSSNSPEKPQDLPRKSSATESHVLGAFPHRPKGQESHDGNRSTKSMTGSFNTLSQDTLAAAATLASIRGGGADSQRATDILKRKASKPAGPEQPAAKQRKTVSFDAPSVGAPSSIAQQAATTTSSVMSLATILVDGKATQAAEQHDSRKEQADTPPNIVLRLPLDDNALELLNDQQRSSASLPAPTRKPLPATNEIVSFHNVPPAERLQHFESLAARIGEGLSNNLYLPYRDKEAMTKAVLDLAGQTQYLAHGDERRVAWSEIDELVTLLPKMEGAYQEAFGEEYARVKTQMLGSEPPGASTQ